MTHPMENIANPGGSQLEPVLQPCILLADDDVEMRRLLAFTLTGEGYEVIECANGMEILERLGRGGVSSPPQPYALVITDLRMPGIDGLDLLCRLSHRRGVPPVILITAFGDAQAHLQARQLGAAASVDKPFEIPGFLDLVRLCIRRSAPRDRRANDASKSL